ncbi:MAG: DUF1036 domain-containing protein [Pseudomonadota bacterium]
MVPVRLFLSGLVLLLLAFSAQSAEAQANRGWELCNETSFVIEAAIGRPEGSGIVVEGWTKLRPGTCETTLAGPLTPGVHFLYGRTSDAHRGGERSWGGGHELCVDTLGSFSVESLEDCTAMGLEAQGFRPVLIERANRWSTTFSETDDFGMKRAAAAGVQRLLEDAGVYSGKIDGLIGRNTRSAIAEFLDSRNLSSDTSDSDLIDILEQVASDRSREVGFTVCNRTKKRIWSAIARRAGENWESRGWWILEAGGCARVVDEPLLQAEHFVYGEMEEDDGSVRTLSRASDAFCVARAKFAINGRENCEQSAYRTALFTGTPTPEDRKLIFEFFERDFAEPGRGG